jgi:hypothetical protein
VVKGPVGAERVWEGEVVSQSCCNRVSAGVGIQNSGGKEEPCLLSVYFKREKGRF